MTSKGELKGLTRGGGHRCVLVTGSAGFIGFHTAKALLGQGYDVVGLDNLNDYYDPKLKTARLENLAKAPRSGSYVFAKMDLCNRPELERLFAQSKIEIVINLAAQAGVRYSLKHPEAYLKSNLEGFLNILEVCRHHSVGHLIYASSSSVYGGNTKLPFSESDNVDHPLSLYAASKKANELMAHSYAHLYRLPTTGLRFFTVYGPWGRPDMAMYLFADALLSGKPLSLFNSGDMLRDFTYIDDIVESLVRLCDQPACPNSNWDGGSPDPSTSLAPYRIYNIGNNNPVSVLEIVKIMEEYLGKKAIVDSLPMQPGDVPATFADVRKLGAAVDFQPKTEVRDGIKKFLDWYTWYRSVQ